jgi:DNA helicase-2/ATP-dependent DNA helicase PcrA
VLIIGDSTSPTGQRKMASQTPGAVTVEAVDLHDLISFACGFDPNSLSAIERLSQFAQSVMTNVGTPNLLKRVESLKNGRARKAPSEVERAALLLVDTPSYEAALDLLVKIGKEGGTRAYRPAVLRACISALSVCVENPSISFHEAAIRMREQYRFAGRPLPQRAVGSTLLLKGLEAEVAVILNAQGLNVSNFYVAMSRGSKLLKVCSQTPIFTPQ